MLVCLSAGVATVRVLARAGPEQWLYSGLPVRREAAAAFDSAANLYSSKTWFRIGFPQPPGAVSTGMPLFILPDHEWIRRSCKHSQTST